mmetsp:Transcript_19922/g.28347  ORF Transcript_19922/g.28347 Transcript_19922/m.28347 type:complete len:124 (+) Transcript_19922:296-667(+)
MLRRMVARTGGTQPNRMHSVFRFPRTSRNRKWAIDETDNSKSPQHRDSGDVFDLSERENPKNDRYHDESEDYYDVTIIRRANPISERDAGSDGDNEISEIMPFPLNHWLASMFHLTKRKNSHS